MQCFLTSICHVTCDVLALPNVHIMRERHHACTGNQALDRMKKGMVSGKEVGEDVKRNNKLKRSLTSLPCSLSMTTVAHNVLRFSSIKVGHRQLHILETHPGGSNNPWLPLLVPFPPSTSRQCIRLFPYSIFIVHFYRPFPSSTSIVHFHRPLPSSTSIVTSIVHFLFTLLQMEMEMMRDGNGR